MLLPALYQKSEASGMWLCGDDDGPKLFILYVCINWECIGLKDSVAMSLMCCVECWGEPTTHRGQCGIYWSVRNRLTTLLFFILKVNCLAWKEREYFHFCILERRVVKYSVPGNGGKCWQVIQQEEREYTTYPTPPFNMIMPILPQVSSPPHCQFPPACSCQATSVDFDLSKVYLPPMI